MTSTSVELINEKVSELHTLFAVANAEVKKLNAKLDTQLMNLSNIGKNILSSGQSLKSITSKMKSLLTAYAKKTTILDNTIGVLHKEMESVTSAAEKGFQEKTGRVMDVLTEKVSELMRVDRQACTKTIRTMTLLIILEQRFGNTEGFTLISFEKR